MSHSIYVLAFFHPPPPLRYGGGRKSIGRIMMLLSAAPRRPYIRRRHQFTTQPLDLSLVFFSSICPLYLFVKAAGVWAGKTCASHVWAPARRERAQGRAVGKLERRQVEKEEVLERDDRDQSRDDDNHLSRRAAGDVRLSRLGEWLRRSQARLHNDRKRSKCSYCGAEDKRICTGV